VFSAKRAVSGVSDWNAQPTLEPVWLPRPAVQAAGSFQCGLTWPQALVQIRFAAKRPDGPGAGTDDEKKPKMLWWKESIPPQKWTTFYMKVVSPFASATGLNLRVEVQIPADENDQQSKAQADRIRNALRDLGLDESVDFA
jgi:hypothetical protein